MPMQKPVSANDIQSTRLYSGGDENAVPDDVQEMHLAERAGALEIVQALGDALVKTRKAAQDYRASTGIEQDWLEDEDFYQSIDKANPEGETNVGKPVSANGGPIGIPATAMAPRSTVFIPITRAYVDAASARVGDMLLPTDDSSWAIKPTPVQSIIAGTKVSPVAAAAGAVAGSRPMPDGGVYEPGKAVPPMDATAAAAMGMSPEAAAAPAPYSIPMNTPPVVQSATDKTPEDLAAEEATKVITDWHIECQWHGEVRKVIEDASLLGTGILKGPFPMMKVSQKWTPDPATGRGRLQRITEMKPVSKRIHPRNLWCDPAAGEDIQNGSYTWEYDQIGSRFLRKLKEDPSYIPEMIDKVLKEGPGKTSANRPEAAEWQVDVGAVYPLWYFYGDIDRETLIAAGIPEEDFPDDGDVSIPAMITLVNDTVIKAALNPMESGGFPYDVMPWQRRSGMIWGKGIARQIRTPQRMLNASVRSMMDNGGLTSGPQWAVRKKWVKPLGRNEYSLVPRGGWEMTEDAPPTAKIGDAISFTNIEANTVELEKIVQLALKFGEDATGLPMLMQGQQGAAPDTVGGMTILNNNGSTVLRRIARTFDDHITERHIRRYYHWLLENEGNDSAKGDFQIDARGSTALVERDLANQALNQLAPLLIQHPDVHKGRLAEELLKANRLDPKRVMMTEAEKKQRDAAPPPVPESVQVQQMRNEGAMQLFQGKAGLEMKLAEGDGKLREAELQAKWELGLGALANAMGMNEKQLKAKLFETVSKLNTQVALSDADRAHGHAMEKTKAILTPPTEPAGTAKKGEAYEA